MNMEKELKEELGLDKNSTIPADFTIPYFVHQDDMNKMDMSHRRVEKWHIIIIILLILLLVSTNAYWIYYESQFEDVLTVEQDAEWDSGNVILNGTGEVSINGESTPNDN